MAKVMIKILQGSAVRPYINCELMWTTVTILQLQISFSYNVYVPNIMKVGWQYTKFAVLQQ